MITQGNKITIGTSENGEIVFDTSMANRHGLIAGATGTGKTYTIKALAEAFSSMGVAVFLADVKGDVVGLSDCNPVNIWDIFGETGTPLRTTVDSMGSVLLARILRLNPLQTDLLAIAFRIAKSMNCNLTNLADLKVVLNYMANNNKDLAMEYGSISTQSIATIVRSVVALEIAGGEKFFGNPAFSVEDFFTKNEDGKSVINILDSSSLINDTYMYSTFMLWLLSELFKTLPEVGDVEKPKMVFFFDEAHLLFKGASKVFLERIEQVVRLIRSKGVGIYFCTQKPNDIPDGVLSQLGNKFQHALHAYTPAEQKGVKIASASFRANPSFDTYETINSLGIGQALVSLLQTDGTPSIVEKVSILPPKSKAGCIDSKTRKALIEGSVFYEKYAETITPESLYDYLMETSEIVQGKRFGDEHKLYLYNNILTNPSFCYNNSWKYGVAMYALDIMDGNLKTLSDYDIATRLCSERDLKYYNYGSIRPQGETWQEVERRAIDEAYKLARSILRIV